MINSVIKSFIAFFCFNICLSCDMFSQQQTEIKSNVDTLQAQIDANYPKNNNYWSRLIWGNIDRTYEKNLI